jgi:hypothetical protein
MPERGAKPVPTHKAPRQSWGASAGRVSVTIVVIRMPDIMGTIFRRWRRDRISDGMDAEQAIDAAEKVNLAMPAAGVAPITWCKRWPRATARKTGR